MYKYVNKKNISVEYGGIAFTPYSGYTSSTPVPALDVMSNGWDLDRYYNDVLANTSNDDIPIGKVERFTGSPGAGWLKCDGAQYLRANYPGLSSISTMDGCDITSYIGDGISAPSDFSGGYIAPNGRAYVKDYGPTSPNGDMWSTDDRGITWTKHSNMVGVPSYDYGFYSNGASLLVGVSYDNGIIYSTDGGLTWNPAAVPPTNPSNLGFSDVTFDGNRFVLVSVTSSSQNITSGKFYAYSVDGSNWTTVQLPEKAQADNWIACRRASPYAGYTYVYSETAKSMRIYGSTIYGPYTGTGMASMAAWGVYLYSQVSSTVSIYIDYTGNLCKSTSGALRVNHPSTAVSTDYADIVATVGNTSIAFGNAGGLYMSFDTGVSWNYQKNVLPYYGGPDGIVVGSDFFLTTVYSSQINKTVTLRWEPNTSKFCVPSLPQEGELAYYIYAGA